MDRVVLKNYMSTPEALLAQVEAFGPVLYPRLWNRYDNPFEQKWALDRAQLAYQPWVRQIRDSLVSRETMWWASRLLDVPISHGDAYQYGGVFIYEPGGYLHTHLDAGRHPVTGRRKVATACLYLTPASLGFWRGDPGFLEEPLYDFMDDLIHVEASTLVLFSNHDEAYHGVPIVVGEPRVCITVSYMAPDGFEHPRFQNNRTRAYFARSKWEEDTSEIAELRKKRASEEHHEQVYRVGV